VVENLSESLCHFSLATKDKCRQFAAPHYFSPAIAKITKPPFRNKRYPPHPLHHCSKSRSNFPLLYGSCLLFSTMPGHLYALLRQLQKKIVSKMENKLPRQLYHLPLQCRFRYCLPAAIHSLKLN